MQKPADKKVAHNLPPGDDFFYMATVQSSMAVSKVLKARFTATPKAQESSVPAGDVEMQAAGDQIDSSAFATPAKVQHVEFEPEDNLIFVQTDTLRIFAIRDGVKLVARQHFAVNDVILDVLRIPAPKMDS